MPHSHPLKASPCARSPWTPFRSTPFVLFHPSSSAESLSLTTQSTLRAPLFQVFLTTEPESFLLVLLTSFAFLASHAQSRHGLYPSP